MTYFLKNKNKTVLFFILFGAVFFLGTGLAQAADSITATLLGNAVEWMLKPILGVLFEVMGFIFTMAAGIFAWIISAENARAILDNPVIYTVWASVRDFTNMFFILVLLFSAFATIFQISKYNIRNVILTLVLMALLVNFSFPIARFIVDVSNVIMYEFLSNMFSGDPTTLGAVIGKESSIVKMLTATNTSGKTALYLTVAIIFLFLLAITIMAIALLLVIRLTVLAILIMLSPVGFVGNIFPAFEKYADDWWSALFKYAFSGPILIFFLAVSVAFMQQMQGMFSSARNLATQSLPAENDPNFLAAAIFMVLPIVLLWTGMAAAQKMGIAGAGMATKFRDGAAKKLSGYNWGKKNWGDFRKARETRKESAKSLGTRLASGGKILGKDFQGINNMQDATMARMGSSSAKKRYDERREKGNKESIDKKAKEHVENGDSADTLAITMNANFSAGVPTTQDEKIKQAAAATAYLRQDADERKMHIQNTIAANGGLAGSDLNHIINAAPPAGLSAASIAAFNQAQVAAQASAARIAADTAAGRSPKENDLRTVSSFVSRQMKSRVEMGAKA